jgi:hypothetical protein
VPGYTSRFCWFAVLLLVLLTACRAASATSALPPASIVPDTGDLEPAPSQAPAQVNPADSCLVTEPIRIKASEAAAVQDPPAYGYDYVNDDLTIWAAAWWAGEDSPGLRASEGEIKTGWFRPAGATLGVTGRRIDGDAPALHAQFPCCYPTRFRASGLYFPTSGCWQVDARAAVSELSFVVWVAP